LATPTFLLDPLSIIVEHLGVLGRRIGRYWIKRSNLPALVVLKDTSVVVSAGSYLSLLFGFVIDNDTWLDLTIQRIDAHFYMSTAYMGDRIIERAGYKREEASAIQTRFQSDSIPDVPNIKARKEPRCTVMFTPPKDAFKAQNAGMWQMRGIIDFSCSLGVLRVPMSLEFTLDQTSLDYARRS